MPGEPPRRLFYFLERIADTAPGSTALECNGVVRSYAEFDADGNRVAHYLYSLGVRPGDTVGILIDRSLPMYQAILGALKSGATYVPIDPNAPHDRVDQRIYPFAAVHFQHLGFFTVPEPVGNVFGYPENSTTPPADDIVYRVMVLPGSLCGNPCVNRKPSAPAPGIGTENIQKGLIG